MKLLAIISIIALVGTIIATSIMINPVVLAKNVDNEGHIGQKLGESHGNSITLEDFGGQFSRDASDGKSHNPHVPSDGGDDE